MFINGILINHSSYLYISFLVNSFTSGAVKRFFHHVINNQLTNSIPTESPTNKCKCLHKFRKDCVDCTQVCAFVNCQQKYCCARPIFMTRRCSIVLKCVKCWTYCCCVICLYLDAMLLCRFCAKCKQTRRLAASPRKVSTIVVAQYVKSSLLCRFCAKFKQSRRLA